MQQSANVAVLALARRRHKPCSKLLAHCNFVLTELLRGLSSTSKRRLVPPVSVGLVRGSEPGLVRGSGLVLASVSGRSRLPSAPVDWALVPGRGLFWAALVALVPVDRAPALVKVLPLRCWLPWEMWMTRMAVSALALVVQLLPQC